MAPYLSNLGVVGIILSIAIMLASGFLLTRITKRLHLLNVTGYVIAGVIIGFWCLNLVPPQYTEQMDFVTDLAPAFTVSEMGRYFKFSTLKANGKNMVILTLFESLMAGVSIMVSTLLLGLSLSFSLLLGTIGYATAPVSTIMTIRQHKAKGPFIDTILQVVISDDAVALVAFSIYTAFVQVSSGTGAVSISQVVIPVLLNIAAFVMDAAPGIVLSRMINKHRSRDHSLVLAHVTIAGVVDICSSVNISPFLACMASGTTYINASGSKHLLRQLNQFTPPLLVVFFVLSGARLSIPGLAAADIIGVIYFPMRIAGEYAGSAVETAVIHVSPEIRRCFGLTLTPQAGISIGLAVLSQRMLSAESEPMLFTIILFSGLFYEMVGPVCSKIIIKLSGSIPDKEKCTKKERKGDGDEMEGTVSTQARYVVV